MLIGSLLTAASAARAQEVAADRVAGGGDLEWVGAETLRIELVAKGARKPPKPKKERALYNRAFKAACQELGKAMTGGKGPWGFGPFAAVSCYRGNKHVAGPEKATKWVLSMVDGEHAFTFTLKHAKAPVASLSLPGSEYALQFYQDEEFVDTIAYNLLNSTPMAMLVNQGQLKGSPPTLTGRYFRAGKASDFKFNDAEAPDPPEKLIFFRLAWDAGAKRWRSQVVGTGDRTELNAPKKKKVKKHVTLQGGAVVYSVTPSVVAALAQGTVFAQNAEGPGAKAAALQGDAANAQTAMDDAAKVGRLAEFMKNGPANFFSTILATAASGYVGVRYGREVIPGEGELAKLINNTQILGLLVEIRGGPLKGLRYYYDRLFKSTASLTGTNGPVKASIEFSRHVLGFSWDFEPGILVDRITVDPKIGMWTFNATLPTALDASGKVSQVDDFNLGKAFSVGLELGIEEVSDWYTLRGKYAYNTGFSLIRQGSKVTSNAFGADAYFTAGPRFSVFGIPLKTALLAFYVYELTSVNGPAEHPEPGQVVANGLDYSAGYAGGGVALSW